MSDFDLALAHYRLIFPTAASLGSAPACAAWRAEYDRIAEIGLDHSLVTQTGSEAGNTTAIRNFSQTVRMEAILKRRAELDPDFDEQIFGQSPAKPRVHLGTTVVFGC